MGGVLHWLGVLDRGEGLDRSNGRTVSHHIVQYGGSMLVRLC